MLEMNQKFIKRRKKMKRFRNLLLLIIVVAALVACGGSDGPKGPKKVFKPDWYDVESTDGESLYIYGTSAKSTERAAKISAESDAYFQAARYVEAHVKGMMKDFISETGGENPEITALTEQAVKVVANTKFQGTRVVKSETYEMDGKKKVFLRLSIPQQAINKNVVDKIKKEEALYNRFRASQSFQELDKEIGE